MNFELGMPTYSQAELVRRLGLIPGTLPLLEAMRAADCSPLEVQDLWRNGWIEIGRTSVDEDGLNCYEVYSYWLIGNSFGMEVFFLNVELGNWESCVRVGAVVDWTIVAKAVGTQPVPGHHLVRLIGGLRDGEILNCRDKPRANIRTLADGTQVPGDGGSYVRHADGSLECVKAATVHGRKQLLDAWVPPLYACNGDIDADGYLLARYTAEVVLGQ